MNFKYWLKKIAIYLSIFISLILIIISCLVWFVFTPGKLTPIIKKQLPSLITCKSEIKDVELTFFSTFPEFGIKINDLHSFFMLFVYLAGGAAIVLFFLSKPLLKMMHGVK